MRRLTVAVALIAGGTLVGCGPMPPTDPDPDLVQCETERQTIEIALEAYLVSEPGMSYPATLDELIGSYVDPDNVTQAWEYSSTGSAYTLDGPC